MSTNFIKNGPNFHVASDKALDIRPLLPTGTYAVKQNPMTGEYFLESIENFEVRGKLYGDVQKQADRIFTTFHDRPNSTGVMLSGEKGSGKTMLAKVLSVQGLRQGIPTIVINQPHFGEGFNTFMQQIEQPTIVLFDEFEKVYDRDEQEKMLTLLDGVYPSKKMFILTCNNVFRIDQHMRNRPGRIYYNIEYQGLDMQFVRQYAQDNANDQEQVDAVCRVAFAFPKFNFDMLKALIEEMNRYEETPQQALLMLNAKPETAAEVNYKVKLVKGNETLRLLDEQWTGNPVVAERIHIWYDLDTENDEVGLDSVLFEVGDMVKVDVDAGIFEFAKDDFRLFMTREAERQGHWAAY